MSDVNDQKPTLKEWFEAIGIGIYTSTFYILTAFATASIVGVDHDEVNKYIRSKIIDFSSADGPSKPQTQVEPVKAPTP